MVNVAVMGIVFNGDYVLEPMLECVYPFVSEIVMMEGPVGYFQRKGFTTSTDRTNEILHDFPDPDHKLHVGHGQFREKELEWEACHELLEGIPDYVWLFASDEVYTKRNVQQIVDILENRNPDGMGFRFLSFYAFPRANRYMTGFEGNYHNTRLQRYFEGAQFDGGRRELFISPHGDTWLTHDYLFPDEMDDLGIKIYHYSYCWPSQIGMKIPYYHEQLAPKITIPDYFKTVYLPWVLGSDAERGAIENRYDGVHDFLPEHRGPCRTKAFGGQHPKPVRDRLPELEARFDRELRAITG